MEIHMKKGCFKTDLFCLKRVSILLSLSFCFPLFVFSQNTVGVLSKANNANDGYNLIFPHNQQRVFLLNNNGQLVHHWEDESGLVPGNGVYLMPNGNLIKCKRPNTKDDPIYAPGAGATVDVVSWEGDVLHTYTLNDDKARLHHDIAPMPNGNVLMIAWEKFSMEEAVEAGRDPNNLPQEYILSEMILEWDPVQNKIVWEWHVWDHLIQNQFPDKSNFGNIEQNSGKIDINYDEHGGHPDWLHINSINYNPVLDQFVLSVPYFNEFWIIDHSTSIAEAKTNTGGKFGRGGEILFRFGNDKTYLSQPNEQQLFFQHDVHWIDPEATEGMGNFGKIALFNNRVPDTTSIGMLIKTLDDVSGSYLNPVQNPKNLVLTKYIHPDKPNIAYSTGLSSVHVFENGHALLFAGRYGYGYELDTQGNIVWEYRVPIKAGKPIEQGTVLGPNDNITFRMEHYSKDYEAFQGKNLTSKGLLEELEFEESEVVTSLDHELQEEPLLVYPNPFENNLFIEANTKNKSFQILTVEGRRIKEGTLLNGINVISSASFQQGIYILKTETEIVRIVKK